MTAEARADAGRPLPKTVAYGGAGFEEAVASVGRALEGGRGLFIALVGGSSERCKQAVADLMAGARLNTHQFDLSNLMAERYIDTQTNLRKAFDRADENAALLCFDRAETLLEPPRDEDAKQDELTPADYFLQRAEAYEGVLVLCLSDERHLSILQQQGLDVVVEL